MATLPDSFKDNKEEDKSRAGPVTPLPVIPYFYTTSSDDVVEEIIRLWGPTVTCRSNTVGGSTCFQLNSIANSIA